MAKTFASSNGTKEFRVSCLSARQGSPVDTGLSLSIGRGCCYVIAIHFWDSFFLIGEKLEVWMEKNQ